MQRDMKLGIALGVALVGIVGALFFRHEPAAQESVPPPLADAAELDDRIAEKGKTPYLSGLDEFPDAPAPAPPTTAKSEASPPAASKTKPEAYEPPSFLTKEDQAEHRVFLSSDRAAAPDPIVPPGGAPPTRMHVTAFEEEVPAHNRDWQAGDAMPGHTNGTSHSAARPTGRTHVIQSGDTLSSIAAKYLGSSARYREIYEANRQVLRSPDDLPNGVTITIPDKAAPATPGAPVAGHSAEGDGLAPKTRQTSVRSTNPVPRDEPLPSANANEAPSGKLRFAPVRRNPFSAGRTAGGARPATERAVPEPAAPERQEPELPPPPPRREVKSREMPASPPQKANPSKARLELDDSDPFDAPQ